MKLQDVIFGNIFKSTVNKLTIKCKMQGVKCEILSKKILQVH